MSILAKIKDILTSVDIDDEQLYARVAQEIARGQYREGLWVKALSESNFEQARAQALYVRMMVAALKDEARQERKLQAQAETHLMNSAFVLFNQQQYAEAAQGMALRIEKRNDRGAMACLGYILWHGLSLKADQRAAVELFDAAEKSKDVKERLTLARMLEAIDWRRALKNYDFVSSSADEKAREAAREYKKRLQLQGLIKKPLLQRLLK